ncbi:hypothetical protein SAMN05216584_105115 [Selenomonas sp. WCT3]|uniref:hypothetical protein n=1 Tax=Selenomonas sp. WCT3 TaxID=3158785 RepID=UPI00088DD228|nr:hypothetical protein SAMN05216584_105115 [Selenomonas ruminantium]
MGEDRQQGAVSLLLLCMLLVVMVFSFGLLYFIRAGQQANDSYACETRLRLAAESMVELVALRIEQNPQLPSSWPEDKVVDIKLAAMHLAEVAPPEGVAWKAGGIKRRDKLYLLGYAKNNRNKKPWEECRLVKGEMQKVGERYVWLGWAP